MNTINAKITFCSLFYSLTLFQQNANFRIFTTSTMGHLNEAQYHRAVGMVEGRLSFREVAKRMGCSHQTIMKLIERNATTGSVSDRQRPGRLKVTSQCQDRNIVQSHLRNCFGVKTVQILIRWLHLSIKL